MKIVGRIEVGEKVEVFLPTGVIHVGRVRSVSTCDDEMTVAILVEETREDSALPSS